jgi:hypothetical protein
MIISWFVSPVLWVFLRGLWAKKMGRALGSDISSLASGMVRFTKVDNKVVNSVDLYLLKVLFIIDNIVYCDCVECTDSTFDVPQGTR